MSICRHIQRRCDGEKWSALHDMNSTFSYIIGYLCFRGKQTMDLTVIEGGPLPFAFAFIIQLQGIR